MARTGLLAFFAEGGDGEGAAVVFAASTEVAVLATSLATTITNACALLYLRRVTNIYDFLVHHNHKNKRDGDVCFFSEGSRDRQIHLTVRFTTPTTTPHTHCAVYLYSPLPRYDH